MEHRNRGEVGSKQATATGRIVIELDHAIGIGISERLQQNRVDHGKDGGVGSDAQRQGGNRGDGEAGVLEEHAQRVLNLLPQMTHAPFPPQARRAGL